jgi:hypothetical protein
MPNLKLVPSVASLSAISLALTTSLLIVSLALTIFLFLYLFVMPRSVMVEVGKGKEAGLGKVQVMGEAVVQVTGKETSRLLDLDEAAWRDCCCEILSQSKT